MHGFFNTDPQGRPVLDLRREAANHRVDLAALPELSAEERGTAIRTWRGRMVNEHISAGVWAVLVRQLMVAAAPPFALAAAARAVSDELRHAELCAGVVLSLGGSPVAPLPELVPVPEHEDAGPLEAVLRNIVSVGCLSETIAVSIIRAEHAELEGGPLAEVLGGILADEVSHARFGWSLLGALLPRLDSEARARLDTYLIDALAHQVTYEIPKLPVVAGRRAEIASAGVCDGLAARALFFETIEGVIVPGLDRAGLAGQAAWRQARAETAHVS